MTIDFFSAFIVGILGSGHCLGMCGGITTMLTSALSPEISANANRKKTIIIICYHVGRISSYAFIGAIVAFTGSTAAKNIGIPLGVFRIISALFLILLGLYLGQWLMWLTKVERLGKTLWQYISPLSKRLIPVNSPIKALGLGALWGWLPCGLVYSMLTWSLASNNVFTGAGVMLFFGLGTLPALLAVSFSITSFKALLLNKTFRKSMATLLIVYGIYSLYVAYLLML